MAVPISSKAFQKANQNVLPHEIVSLMGSRSGRKLLEEIATFHKAALTIEEIRLLQDNYLVWYKPNKDGEAQWNRTGCMNYTVGEYVAAIRKQKVKNEGITAIATSLKKGLRKDVLLVGVFDTTFSKRVIVDGNKRAVSLNLLSEKVLSKLLNGRYGVKLIELRSPLAHMLYPSDFLQLARLTNGGVPLEFYPTAGTPSGGLGRQMI